MDAVLLKLGVKLSKEAFNKMLKDSDVDSNLNLKKNKRVLIMKYNNEKIFLKCQEK